MSVCTRDYPASLHEIGIIRSAEYHPLETRNSTHEVLSHHDTYPPGERESFQEAANEANGKKVSAAPRHELPFTPRDFSPPERISLILRPIVGAEDIKSANCYWSVVVYHITKQQQQQQQQPSNLAGVFTRPTLL